MTLATTPMPAIIEAMITPKSPENIKYVIPPTMPAKKDSEMTIANQAITSVNNSKNVINLLEF